MKCLICDDEAVLTQHGWTCLKHDKLEAFLLRKRNRVEATRVKKLQLEGEPDPLIVDVKGRSNYGRN